MAVRDVQSLFARIDQPNLRYHVFDDAAPDTDDALALAGRKPAPIEPARAGSACGPISGRSSILRGYSTTSATASRLGATSLAKLFIAWGAARR